MKHFLIFWLVILPLCTVFAQKQKTTLASGSDKLRDKVVLQKISFEGNKVTRGRVLLREMSIGEYDTLDKDDIDKVAELNRKRLMNLSLFTEVVFTTTIVNDSTIEWLVKVKEQWFIIPELTLKLADRNFNVWWDEQNHDIRRANLGVAFKHRNFRGNMEQLSATVQVGYTQKFGLEYFRPYIDKQQKHGVGVSFFSSKNEETFFITDSNKLRFVKKPGNYIIRNFEAAALYVYRPGYADRHTVELRYRDLKVDDTILLLNKDYFNTGIKNIQLMELMYRYDYNGVDNWNYPLTGRKVVGYAVARVGIKGFDYQTYLLGEFGYFKRLGRKWLLAEIARARVSLPEKPPYSFRAALGTGSEYVRGYEYYVVDGSQYGIFRSNLKYELVNTAIRIPIRYVGLIPIRIYPKVFADAGYVKNPIPGNSFLNNRMLYSAGFGVDFVSAYDFKLRLEYAWNHLGQKGLYLHINSE